MSNMKHRGHPMPRPPSGEPERVYFRRSPAWCAEMTALVQQAAALIQAQKLYFPYSLGHAGLNTSGIVEGAMEQMAAALPTITDERWQTYINAFADMVFIGERKGLHFEPTATAAFKLIGAAMEGRERPTGVKLSWKGEYSYPLVMAVALLWFVDTHSH